MTEKPKLALSQFLSICTSVNKAQPRVFFTVHGEMGEQNLMKQHIHSNISRMTFLFFPRFKIAAVCMVRFCLLFTEIWVAQTR